MNKRDFKAMMLAWIFIIITCYAVAFIVGCVHKTYNYKFRNCAITEANTCDCRQGEYIGTDAKTHSKIIDCRSNRSGGSGAVVDKLPAANTNGEK